MVVEAFAGMSALKSAYDLAKGLIDVRDATVLQGKVFELQRQILSAQESALAANNAQATLLEEISQLKAAIAGFEAWDTEKKRYQLTDFGGGTFAYVLKPEAAAGEPAHRLCARCYGEGHKSILQFKFQTMTHQDKYQ